MPNGFDTLLNATGKALETVPDAYNDVIQPAAKESGKTLSLIPRTINAALIPLQCWIAKAEYRLAETEKLLAIKLEHIGEEKIITPDPYVAVPALQAISYSMDSNELRELYANLLAKAMNIDTKNTVHPSFVETIKQVSPSDASYFQRICPLETRPMIELRLELHNSLRYTVSRQCNNFSIGHEKTYPLSINNLSRLGLINIPQDVWYGEDSLYSDLISYLQRKFTLEQYKSDFPTASGFEYYKQRIDITDYGYAFYNTCVI